MPKKNPKKNTSKRNNYELERDRALVAEYALQGLSDRVAAKRLNARPGVSYTISKSTVARDRKINLERLREVALIPTEASLNMQLARISLVERESWEAWQRSKKPQIETREIQKLREWVEETDDEKKIEHSEMVMQVIDTLTRDQVGDYRYLDLIAKMIDRRAKLEGQYTERVHMQIHKKEEVDVNIKMFHTVNPFMWDDPSIQVIDGEVVKDGKVLQIGPGSDNEAD